MELQQITGGLSNPVFVTNAPRASSRLFIAEQTGNIRIFDLNSGSLLSTPFLSQSQMSAGTGFTHGGERGLLGLAFDPNFQTSGRFHVNNTATGGHNRTTAIPTRGRRSGVTG